MKATTLISLFALLACSSGPAPGQSPTVPHPNGIGRMPSLPVQGCPQTRATAALPAAATISSCHTDADCVDGHNGRCLQLSNHGPHGPALEGTTCSFDACFTDADCPGEHQMCRCGERTAGEPAQGHFCVGGDCDHDSDCGAGRYCRRGPIGKYCHSPADHCVEDTDCGERRGCQRNESSGLYECVAIAPILG